MSLCATVPTQTQFQVFTSTSDSLSVSASILVTTLPAAVVTSTTTLCSSSSNNSVCSTATVVVTGAASTSTISVPVTITVPVTFTTSNPTRTLFSTSCNASPASPASSTSSASPLASQAPPSSATDTPTSTSQFTVISSPSATTLSDGNVVTTQVFVTTTSPPQSTVLSSLPSPSLNHSAGAAKSSSKTAPIIGGAVGGVVALLAIIGGVWYIWRRSQRWKDIFDQEEDAEKRRSRMSVDGDVEPRPYHYGLVGHSTSPSPPGSPPMGAVNRPGHSPANSLSLLNAPPHASRSSSGGDMSSPATMTRSLSDLASASVGGHVRPNLSTASSGAASTRPLLERPINHSRTPSAWSVDGQNTIGAPGRPRTTPPSTRPHSAGEGLQNTPASAAVTEPLSWGQSAPAAQKRRLLAALPSGAAAPAPPLPTDDNASHPVPGSSSGATSNPPPIRKRNPNRPSSSKGSDVVTVHTDAGPAAEPDQQSIPDENQPPAYSPT